MPKLLRRIRDGKKPARIPLYKIRHGHGTNSLTDIHEYSKWVFNYPIFYENGYRFDGTRARKYPYSLIN